MDAVIFDMDGVIVDSELQWKAMEGLYLQSLIPRWNEADQARITGMSVHHVYDMLASEYDLKRTREEFMAFYQPMITEIYTKRVSLLEGFSELIQTLDEHRVPVALASSSPMNWIDMVLERFDLRKYFAVIVSADQLQGKGKPAPDIYLRTAELLGVRPERCLAIEDSENGVRAAKSAGMFCVGLRNGFNDDQDISLADLIVHSLAELDCRKLEDLNLDLRCIA